MAMIQFRVKTIMTIICILLGTATTALGIPLSVSAATVATDGVMVRNDAATDAGIIGSLNEGDEVEILDVIMPGDGYLWYYIEMDNGNHGYMRSDLVNATEEELAAFNVQDDVKDTEDAQDSDLENDGNSGSNAENSSNKKSSRTNSIKHSKRPNEEEYDAFRDPNASFSVRFEQDAEGTGSWYVYNEDNGSRMRLRDLQDQENSDSTSVAHESNIWKILSIILFWILTAVLSFICGRKWK